MASNSFSFKALESFNRWRPVRALQTLPSMMRNVLVCEEGRGFLPALGGREKGQQEGPALRKSARTKLWPN